MDDINLCRRKKTQPQSGRDTNATDNAVAGHRQHTADTMIFLVVWFTLLVLAEACSSGGASSTAATTPATASQEAVSQPTATDPVTETTASMATVPPTTNAIPPSPTATPQPSSTPTSVPQPAVTTTETTAPSASATPSPAPATSTATMTFNPQPDCAVLPEGGFLTIWQSDPQLQARLGCPTSGHPRTKPAAWQVETSYQPFQHGIMIWSSKDGWYEQPLVFVLYQDGTYQRFEDTFDPNTAPVSGGDTPPDGLFEPKFGFGKVWRQEPGVRDRLGWATAEESSGNGRFQIFDMQHRMVWISQTNQTYLFLAGGTVRIFDVPF